MKRTLAAALVLVSLASVRAEDAPRLLHQMPSSSIKCEDGLAELPALAERLGVKPGAKDGVVLHLCDGRTYSFLELVHALLDRLDAAERAPPAEWIGKAVEMVCDPRCRVVRVLPQ